MSDVGSGAPSGSASPAPAQGSSSELSNSGVAQESTTGGENLQAENVGQIQDALENGDISPAEAKQMIKQFKLKVGGKEITREVNLSDDNYLRDQLQLAEMSRIKMQESAELKKAYQSELARLKSKPWEVLKDIGLDPDELAEMRIQERIEQMKKSPEQIEKEKIQLELEQARQEAKQLKEEKERIEMERLQQQAAVQIEDEIVKALDAHKTLPRSQYVVKRIADSMLWAMNNGFNDVSAEDVVPLVEKEMREELNRLYDEMPEEALEAYIGRKNIDRMRKKRVAQVKTPSNIGEIKPTTASLKASEQASKPAQPVRSKDFFRNLGKNK